MSDTSGPVCHPNSSYLLSSLWGPHWEPTAAFVPSSSVVLDETQCYPQPTFLKQDAPPLRSDVSYSRELPTGNRVPDDTPGNSTRLDEHSPGSNGYAGLAPDSMADTAPNLVPQQLPRGSKRGPFSDATLRWQTAETRKIGSCIRCTMQRTRCKSNPVDPRGECLTCSNLTGQSHRHFPCMRYKLTSLRLIQPEYGRGDQWIRIWNHMILNPIQSWTAVQAKPIRISDGLGNKCIEVFVREFVGNNRQERMQVDVDTGSGACSILAPAHALIDLKACEAAYANYIPEITGSALKQFSGPPDQLLYQTYRLACQIYQDPTTPNDSLQLLGLAFKLWTAVRLLTIPTFIVADTTLDQARPLARRTPVPPAVSAQMQIVLLHYIQGSIRPDLISKLRSMMRRNRKDAWLTMYLATFILLHNITLLMAHDASEERCRGTNVDLLPMSPSAAV
ncbi:hypothetical protein PCL_12099 [Purpureocillium lilacinum]|uniref:Zn(2)-C6 fungal-type domain-containing protein n=1 Tax=Purpureocillium lilacinum TaxID=33203 RepID=A0A2U3DPG6_PURLI|nr:hypothetical protein PCL_12099 [Purpureocillium lilacinum]